MKTLVTPKGTLRYPHLQKPDDKFGDPQYKAKLYPSDKTQLDNFKKKLDELYEKEYEEVGKKAPKADNGYPVRVDADGMEFIDIKMNDVWPSGDKRNPPFLQRGDQSAWPAGEQVNNGAVAQVVCGYYGTSKPGKFFFRLTPDKVVIFKNGDGSGANNEELAAAGVEWEEPQGSYDTDAEPVAGEEVY